MATGRDFSNIALTRRTALKGLGAAAGLGLAPGYRALRPGAASAPIKIGFQAHRTGIGAAYGRWYEQTTNAAVKVINDAGGIGGRPVEVIVEDDGTDPKRGAEVVGKFATQHKVDVAFGTLFSHVVIGSAPARRRAEDALLRGERGPSRRLGQAQPLLLPARHHRREEPGASRWRRGSPPMWARRSP